MKSASQKAMTAFSRNPSRQEKNIRPVEVVGRTNPNQRARLNMAVFPRSGKMGDAQEVLEEGEELYRFLFHNSNDAIFVSLRKEDDTLPGRFILVNDVACQRLGYTREELLQMSPLDISEPLSTIPGTLETLARNGQVIHEELHIAKNGQRIPVEINTRSFELKGKQFNLSIARDISERKRMEDKLKQLSIHDSLTGLYNRGFFEEELARFEHGRQFPISIVMADVDRLKDMNDYQGHAAGDELLKHAAQVLKAALRSDDIVARIGGDEFAVILPNTGAIAAKNALLRLQCNLQKHNALHAGIPLSISFGVSTAETSKFFMETLKEADANMYCDKRNRLNANRTITVSAE